MKAKGRKVDLGPRMNKTEAAYAQELEILMHTGEIAWFRFEAIKLRLAKNTWYTPDFLIMYPDGSLKAVEIKGFLRDDAAVKFKTCAEMYPWMHWLMIRKKPKKHGGGWETIYEI